MRHKKAREVTVEFRVSVREAITDLGKEPRRVSLKFVLEGANEFRFQMRPSSRR